ncbi:unnamed protein product [Arabidopsis thaliana]|uniref:(thale cress) hypothetical protein n=1 Tax=Arabidopsis thaliana TaxID=3702 RepID=A0A7G2EN60_ARATH|nr:unnamed protein product [Arabidopsis thaliana]
MESLRNQARYSRFSSLSVRLFHQFDRHLYLLLDDLYLNNLKRVLRSDTPDV